MAEANEQGTTFEGQPMINVIKFLKLGAKVQSKQDIWE
jgi:hypothetical protein